MGVHCAVQNGTVCAPQEKKAGNSDQRQYVKKQRFKNRKHFSLCVIQSIIAQQEGHPVEDGPLLLYFLILQSLSRIMWTKGAQMFRL